MKGDSPGRIEEFVGWEELLPVENVAAGEETDDVCNNLIRSPTIDRSVGPDNYIGLLSSLIIAMWN